jgi:hypothetical protein
MFIKTKTNPKSFEEWSEHYGYKTTSEEAKADYKRYQEQLARLQTLFYSESKEKSHGY